MLYNVAPLDAVHDKVAVVPCYACYLQYWLGLVELKALVMIAVGLGVAQATVPPTNSWR